MNTSIGETRTKISNELGHRINIIFVAIQVLPLSKIVCSYCE